MSLDLIRRQWRAAAWGCVLSATAFAACNSSEGGGFITSPHGELSVYAQGGDLLSEVLNAEITLCPNLNPSNVSYPVSFELVSDPFPSGADANTKLIFVSGTDSVVSATVSFGTWYFNENTERIYLGDLMRHELRHAVLRQDDPLPGKGCN